MTKVFITRWLPLVRDQLLKRCIPQLEIDMYENEEHPIPRQELLQRVQGCTGIFCLLTEQMDAQVFQSAGPQLKVISTMSVGYNHIDIQQCQQLNIKVGYTPNVLNITTAETTVALTFAVQRKLIACHQDARNGNWGTWQCFQFCGRDISQSTIGIIGLGRIGATYAKMMKEGFQCKILYTSRQPHPEIATPLNAMYCSMKELLQQSDIVSVHCALTPETKHLIGQTQFQQMQSHAILLNTSRGEVVDQDALYEALQKKQIAAAGLDVTTPEPLPTSHPLFQLDNCTVLPHIGSATIATRTKMATLAVDNLVHGILDEPLINEVPQK